MYKCMLISDHLLHLTITLMLLSCSPNFPHTQYLDIYTLMHALIILLVHASVYIQQLFFEIEVNSGWIFTELRKWRGKYSNSYYSLRLKRIIVLVYTHEVISTKSERKPLKSTIWLTDKITRKFKNRSLQNFQTWHFTSLSFRKQQRNGLNGTTKSLNCFFTWEEK